VGHRMAGSHHTTVLFQSSTHYSEAQGGRGGTGREPVYPRLWHWPGSEYLSATTTATAVHCPVGSDVHVCQASDQVPEWRVSPVPAPSGYPSSLPALSTAAAARQLPVLVVGAALNTDVVPPEANWKRFTAAAAGGGSPVWELVLRGSSHLQFLDKQQPLFALFSTNGPTPDEVVRQITQVGGTSWRNISSACVPRQREGQSPSLPTLDWCQFRRYHHCGNHHTVRDGFCFCDCCTLCIVYTAADGNCVVHPAGRVSSSALQQLTSADTVS